MFGLMHFCACFQSCFFFSFQLSVEFASWCFFFLPDLDAHTVPDAHMVRPMAFIWEDCVLLDGDNSLCK